MTYSWILNSAQWSISLGDSKYSSGAGEGGCYQRKEGKHSHCLLVLTVSEMCDFDISKYLSFGHKKKKYVLMGTNFSA